MLYISWCCRNGCQFASGKQFDIRASQSEVVPGAGQSFTRTHTRSRQPAPIFPPPLSDWNANKAIITVSVGQMEITDLFYTRREEALLSGDYNTYRTQTSRRLHTIRKKLGRTTPKGRKFNAEAPVTSGDVASDTEYV